MKRRSLLAIPLCVVLLIGFGNQEAKALIDAQMFVTLDILNSPVPGGTIDVKFTYLIKNIGDVTINQFNIQFPTVIFGGASFSGITGPAGWSSVGTLPPQFQFFNAVGLAAHSEMTFMVTVTGADFDAWLVNSNWSGNKVGSQSWAILNTSTIELGSGHTVVPEPTTITLVGLGLLGAGIRRFRRRKNGLN